MPVVPFAHFSISFFIFLLLIFQALPVYSECYFISPFSKFLFWNISNEHNYHNGVSSCWYCSTFALFIFLWYKHAAVCVLSRVWLLCDPIDCSLPGLSVHGISQARIVEWAAISYSRGFSPPRDLTHLSCVSCIGMWILYHCTTWKAHKNWYRYTNIFCWNIWK